MGIPFSHILLFVVGFLLFFSGLYLFRSFLRLASSTRLSLFLAKFTTTPLKGALLGTIITALVQSSSAVMVLTIGLADAGLLTFSQTIGIVLGTNVGTCITVQLFALNLYELSPFFILGGTVLFFLGRKNAGALFTGFGLAFLGLFLIALATSPLVYSPAFAKAIAGLQNRPAAGILFGVVSTAIIQYSSAVIGVLIALSQNDIIPLNTAIPIVLGSNLGTCVTGLLASIGGTSSARQVAAAHLLLNFLGIIAWFPLLGPYAGLISLTSHSTALQIANAHTVFNVVTSFIALPLAKPFANLVKTIVPDKHR